VLSSIYPHSWLSAEIRQHLLLASGLIADGDIDLECRRDHVGAGDCTESIGTKEGLGGSRGRTRGPRGIDCGGVSSFDSSDQAGYGVLVGWGVLGLCCSAARPDLDLYILVQRAPGLGHWA
jgi:hypothetical protein